MTTLAPIHTDNRKRELAQIHVAKAQLGMDDDAYRDVVFAISHSRTRSAADLDWQERQRLIAHLRACGFKAGKQRKQLFPNDPQWKKLYSLWQQLATQGKVVDRRSSALVKFVLHQAGVDSVQWVDAPKKAACIEALKDWLAR